MTLFALQLRAAAATAPRSTRLFSSTRAVRSGSFTLVVPISASKQSVLDRLKDAQDHLVPKTGERDNAAVVLASPDLSSWLEDEAFMSSLLQKLPLRRSAESSSEELDPGVSVLSAVVDGLAVSSRGLSILHGRSESLLPGLWKSKDTTAPRHGGGRNSIYGAADVEAAITVELPPMRPNYDRNGSSPASFFSSSSSPLRVTVPLANTVFQNGRRSTLLASRWSWPPSSDSSSSSEGGEGTYKLMRKSPEELEHQLIVPCSSDKRHTSASVPLLAAAEPRKIAAGLGNIVRQLVLDGKPSPASQELESAIPALLAARRKARLGTADLDAAASGGRGGPLGVWGLVIPPDALSLYDSLQGTLAPAADHSAEAEQRAAAEAAPSLAALLAAGCRLHRILSGGGGWGQKQGLLSLDPQMSHPASLASAGSGGEESNDGVGKDGDSNDAAASMANFLRSLRGETGEQGSDNLATPGAHVQFFVAPLSAGDDTGSDADAAEPDSIVSRKGEGGDHAPAIVLGTHPGYDGRPAAVQQGKTPAAVALISGHFGAVSNQGIFLAGASSGPAVATGTATPRTKLDAPYAFVWNK